jgi:hypothetical protein
MKIYPTLTMDPTVASNVQTAIIIWKGRDPNFPRRSDLPTLFLEKLYATIIPSPVTT